MADRNLHLFYNKIYYEKIGQESFAQDLTAKNRVITDFRFNRSDYSPCEIPCSSAFLLKTTYPGMIPGTGYAHDSGISGAADEITCGFSFDYVTGLPFLPGSSVKGVLRSVFRKCPDAVIGTLGESGTEIDSAAVSALEKRIFGDLDKVDGDDVFLDAVIRCGDKDGNLMGFDYLAPHDNDLFSQKPVNVLHIVKILPDVLLEFRFVLKETVIGETRVAPEVKLELFRQLLLLMGAGAKTNVGYGALTETSEDEALQHLTAAATQHRTPRGEAPANRGYNARGNQNHGGRSRNERGAGAQLIRSGELRAGCEVYCTLRSVTAKSTQVNLIDFDKKFGKVVNPDSPKLSRFIEQFRQKHTSQRFCARIESIEGNLITLYVPDD